MTEDIATPSKIWIIKKRPPAVEVAVISGDGSVNRKARQLRPPKEVKWMCPN